MEGVTVPRAPFKMTVSGEINLRKEIKNAVFMLNTDTKQNKPPITVTK